MHIKIGDITTLSVSEWKVVPDDRQERIELINGVTIQDGGYIRLGEIISCKITIWAIDSDLLRSYFQDRIKVDVTDMSGYIWEDRRIIIKSYSRKAYFPEVFEFELEIWGV